MSGTPELRVGYILKRFPRLSQTFVLNEIAELQRQRVHVTVVARHAPGENEPRPEGVPDVAVHYLDDPGADIVARLREAGVEHLHAHFATWAATTARHLAAELGVGFSFTAHAHDIYHQTVDRARLAALIERATFVVTVSEANRKFLNGVVAAAGGSGHVRRLYNGVDVARLQRSGNAPLPGRILSVGRLVPKKGLAHLIEACRRLKAGACAFECVIVGEGEERDNLERQIEAAGLARDVRLAGAQSHSHTLELLASATVCVLPCVIASDGDRDGLPTVLLEALALGVPVVSTTVSGVPEIVKHGESGLLVPPGDAAALAEAIEALLSSPALRARIVRAGSERAQREFSLARNVTSLKGLFRSAATERRVGA